MLPRHRGMGAHRQRPMAHRMPADIQATVPVSTATEVVIWCDHVSVWSVVLIFHLTLALQLGHTVVTGSR